MKPKEPHQINLVYLLLIGLLLPIVQSSVDQSKRQLDPYTQEKLQEEIKTKIEPLLEKKLQEIVNMPGNQELSKSQIRYLLQQSIKKIQPERFYVDKDEQAKNPSFIGYLSTEDSYLKPELKDGKDQFTLPVNFHIPTTKRSAQQYPDQLYHQQQLQTPNNLNNNGNNGYPQQELIQNYPNIQQLPQNAPQQNQQNFVQPTPNYVLSPQSSPQYIVQQNPQQQQLLTQQQYQNLINQNQQINQQQNQQINQPSIGVYQNQLNSVPQQGQQYSQPVDGLPIKPTTIPLAIPILQRFLERPSSLPLPEQLNIQQPQQPVPIPPQLYYVQQQQGAQPLQQGVQLLQQGVQPIQLQGIPVNGLSIAPQQIQQQQLQSQPLQGNQANGISLRADLQDNLFPQNDEQKYQQPVFSFNEPPPPAEQQIENPPQQQGNVIPPGYQNQVPVNVQNLPLVNTQPVYNGQQISQGINQGRPYYSAQTLPVQGVQNQYGPQGPLPNYQDEQQQYDRPQSEQLNQGNGGVGDPNQGQEQSTEPPIKYNINDELPPINNFQDLLAPPTPSVNQGGSYPQQNTGYRNMNPPSPDRLIYTTPDPQKFEDRVNGIRPPLREQDPLIRGDPGYKPTGQPSPVVTGLRDINIIPIDLINRNTSDKSMKLKYDLPNDLFTLPVHFATPNKTADYQRIREENRLKQNAQNIQSLYDLQKPSNPSNSQNNQNDKNINFLSNNQLLKRDHFSRIKHQSSKITPKVSESLPPKQRTKRNYYYDPPKTPFHLPGEETYSYDVPSHPFGTPMYYGNIEYRYVPLYVPKPTDFFFIIRFCPVTVQKPNNGTTNSTDTTPDVNTVAVDTATKTTTTTTTPETMTTKDMGMPPIKSTGSPSRCVWALVSCCSPGMVNQRSECFSVLGCQGDLADNPCAPDAVMNALEQVSSFYRNTSDALLREDRKRVFEDDYDDGTGSNFNQLFYDDFEVPDNITVSPDSLTTQATRSARLVAPKGGQTVKTTVKTPAKPPSKATAKPAAKPATVKTTTKRPNIKRQT